MNISPTDFASLLCSRLCHDLLSPVGALNNGLELLADEHDPEMRARCLELLNESAKASANKLKFFRLAFGAAGGFGETVDTREAQAAIEGLFGENHRVNVGWMVEDPVLPKQAIKVLMNLALHARVVLCGLISEYNAPEKIGIRNLWQVIVKQATIKGFLIAGYVPRFAEGGAAVADEV